MEFGFKKLLTHSMRRLRLGEEKGKKKKKNKRHDENIYGLLYYIGRS